MDLAIRFGMIRAYALKGTDLQSVYPSNLQAAVWLDISNPTMDEIRRISEVFSINSEDFIDCMDPEERPRFEMEEGYFLLMLRILATKGGAASTPYTTFPVGFFVMPNRLITVHLDAVDVVSYFSQRRRKRTISDSMDLHVTLLGSIGRRYDLLVREIQNKLSEFRQSIIKSMDSEAVENAHQLNNDLVFLNASIFGNSNAIRHMIRQRKIEFKEELKEKLEDIEIDARQNYETTSMYRELLANTLDTYNSAMSNNLNRIMKIIASLSLILMLPTLIASIYGMNVEGIPFIESQFGWVIVLVSVMWAGFLWYVFRKVGWL
ncbi:MAG: magnesium transporter CorA family protein [Methanobacteriota archaeon]|nr:MAG: magnesium transporter CorA family protein [Euryarchaeota archaeon]